MYNLDGKIVFITGAATGIGATVVRDCLSEGVKFIAFLDIDETSGKALEEELQVEYGAEQVKFLKCDVSSEDQLFEAFDTVIKSNGYIDVVINNAGLADESTPQAVRKEIEVNYLAVVNATIKSLELMRIDRGGKGGTIINVSSIGGLCQVSPAFFVYLGTKSAVLQFSNCIGKPAYAAKTGVRIITVCFGVTDTDILRNMRSFDEDVNNQMKQIKELFPSQAKESASKGLLETYKNGKTGSTWLVAKDKPAIDYTETVDAAYKILSQQLE
ncbi:hypothetical protein K1T71_003758 [Dendrolimus kikuchii]|uniref:Uncharacterized protein n=1 Tax=Dendrolimus kikuchii TaxID=765133 RepID=A0ACC1D9B5_9NEOP|nr:hypothetical protein K1T71_003758 [Dendrolimus kikuchii]